MTLPPRKVLFAVATLGLTLLTGSSAYAAPAKGDFDNDGLSDLSSVIVDRTAKTTNWVVRESSGGPNLSYSFNVPGDALVSGRFFGGNASFPGVVYVRDAKLPLEWHVKNPFGTENLFTYGVPGDTVPTQGDVDCDGVADVIVARAGSATHYPGFILWYVALSSRPGVIQEMPFGVVGDKIAVADTDGDACDELVALRGNFTWYSKKLFDPNYVGVQWGATGDKPLLPMDLNGDGKSEYVIARNSTLGGQNAFVRFPDGSYVTIPLGSNTSVPMIGNFFSTGAGFAWQERKTGLSAARQADGSALVFPWGSAAAAIVRPDGTVVQPAEDGSIGGGNTTDGNSNSGDFNCDKTLKLPDGRANNKVNAHNSRNALKLIINSGYANKIRGVTAWVNGEKFDKFHNMGFEYGNRPWWNSDKKITAYSSSKPVTAVFDLTDGTQACMFIKDPTQTVD